jgi:hypothetical protein
MIKVTYSAFLFSCGTAHQGGEAEDSLERRKGCTKVKILCLTLKGLGNKKKQKTACTSITGLRI